VTGSFANIMNTITSIVQTFELIAREVNIRQCCVDFTNDAKKFDFRKPCCGYTLANGILVIAFVDVVSWVFVDRR